MDYASMMALEDSSPSPSEWVIRNKLMLGLGAVTLVWCICIMPLSIAMLNPGQWFLGKCKKSQFSFQDPEPEDTQCIFRRHSEKLELPPKLEVVWIPHFKRYCKSILPTSDWNGCSDSVETNIRNSAEQFYHEAPCKAGARGDLYIGYIFGRYNNLDLPKRLQRNWRNWSLGPNKESAWADEFVVFYKNMTQPHTSDKRKTCKWFYKLPQGFSCGKASPPDRSCGDWDTFRPVPCSQIEVKVLDSKARKCPRRKEKDKYYSISRPSQQDCWAGINWT